MMHRGVRFGLFLLLLVALGGAAYQAVIIEQEIGRAQVTRDRFDAQAWSLALSLADLRAAQQAYVATGQGESFWIGKTELRLEGVRRDLTSLKQQSTSRDGAQSLDSAAGTLQSFTQMDARAREYTTSGQRLLASDLIFTDGLELTATVTRQVETARLRDRAARDEAIRQRRRVQLYWVGGAAAASLLVTLLLVPARRAEMGAVDAGHTLLGAPEAPAATPAGRSQPEPDADQPLDLRPAADLCTDLARVSAPQELPPLLERAARLLEAKGLIVWMVDPTQHALRPVLSHGYSFQALARLGPLSRDDDNATAAAYRTERLQIVRSDDAPDGAIIAPLMTPSGCVGVLAAEVRKGAESRAPLRAVAMILAAQLAALVGGTPTAGAAAQTERSASAAT